METADLIEKIRKLADSAGISVLGFAAASEFEGYKLSSSKRRDPKLTLPQAKTIIVAGFYIGGLVLPSWDKPGVGRTSRLFLSGFFNDVVQQLEPIANLLQEEGYKALVCDNSKNYGSIVPLKLAAIRAGLGWQGKNSLLVTRKYGTFLALGGILTDADLDKKTIEEPNRCKTCKKCQEACPLKALEQDFVLNKVKCLSYLLQNDDLPEKAMAVMGNRVMDCEICQQVCPWNSKHIAYPLVTAMTASFQKDIPTWEGFFALSHLARLSEREYEKRLSPLNTGIPFSIFKRNVSIVIERHH